MLCIGFWVPKYLHKPGFDQQVQFVQLHPALGDQVADLVQLDGNEALFFQWWERKFLLLIVFKVYVWNRCAGIVFCKVHIFHGIGQVANIYIFARNNILHSSNDRGLCG